MSRYTVRHHAGGALLSREREPALAVAGDLTGGAATIVRTSDPTALAGALRIADVRLVEMGPDRHGTKLHPRLTRSIAQSGQKG